MELMIPAIQEVTEMLERRPDYMVRITKPALAEAYIEERIAMLRDQIGDGKVLLALSGGVDSSVVAALLIRAIGKNLVCVHVNHGLLRKGEPEQVIRVFREEMNANLIYVDAVDRFLDKLAGVSDPEQKRHIIGEEFIDVFAEEARKLEDVKFLGQGTIWPDILESDAGIKAHHNAGGLPADIADRFELVEPVRILFKDEVRMVGRALGLPASMVERQPFPGPGLGVRCPGAITRDRLEAVREADAIVREEFEKWGLSGKVWQYFTVVPDFKSTGIRDGKRTFDWPCIIRAINTTDVMEVTVEHLPAELIDLLVRRITSEVPGVNRVLFDYTPKPPATVEYE
ncbi:MAG: glutamine-hydrolyzing GMP synthase [Lachnospiraceae bacterium]|nr:glutamine-hydrolyzing GMP synthase [Lachnospiraceae bacterium]MBQ6544098.1 glutamine-hydrolyzing GMP synthase [Lachnospiraceae bacterium]